MSKIEEAIIEKALEKIDIDALTNKIDWEALTDKIAEKVAEKIIKKEFIDTPIIPNTPSPTPWTTPSPRDPFGPVVVMYGCYSTDFQVTNLVDLAERAKSSSYTVNTSNSTEIYESK
jgi:hypothetical protein